MINEDPWQIIFDKTYELVDALLEAQPESEVDALDIENQVYSVIEDIALEKVDPRADWSEVIKPENKREKLDKKIEDHFNIALRQAAYARIIFESNMQRVKENYAESLQTAKLRELGKEMLAAFSCAQQHATAWRLLIEVRDNSYQTRSKKAAQVKAEKREEREVLLLSLIEPALSRLRPQGGWRSHVLAAQSIAPDLKNLSTSYSLDFFNDEDELTETVEKMIFSKERLRKAYNVNARDPLDKPVKMRNVDGVRVHYSRRDER